MDIHDLIWIIAYFSYFYRIATSPFEEYLLTHPDVKIWHMIMASLIVFILLRLVEDWYYKQKEKFKSD